MTIYTAFFIAIIPAHFSPLNIFQTWPILKTNYLSDHFSAQFKRHPDQMVRSRCTPIKLPCSTTRESMLMVPTKRGGKRSAIKTAGQWNNWAWYWHQQKLWEFVVDYAPVDCCAPKLSSLRAGIASRCKLQLELGEHNSLKPSCRTSIKSWLPGCHLWEVWWPWEPNK